MNESTLRPERLRRLRSLCLELPEAVEQQAWGDPTWRVRGRIFAMQKGNHEGGRPSVWLKVPAGAQPPLVESAPELFFVPPYVGHKGWIGVYLDGPRVRWSALRGLVRVSYGLIAPRSLARALTDDAGGSAEQQAPRARRAKPRHSRTRGQAERREPPTRRRK